MSLRIAHLILRLLLGGTILFSAAAKVGQRPGGTVYDLLVGHNRWANIAFIAAEAAWGAWIISGLWPRTAGLSSILILALFNGLLVRELDAERPRPCGCRGPAALMMSPEMARRELRQSLSLNIALILAAGGVALIPSALTRQRTQR